MKKWENGILKQLYGEYKIDTTFWKAIWEYSSKGPEFLTY